MNTSWTDDDIRRLHAADGGVVLAVTGGGSVAISALLEVPGASRTVLEAVVPYSPEALTAWLGARPEQFASERTARAMAMAGYQRALGYTANDSHNGAQPAGATFSGAPLAGIGCAASLASDRPKRGPHRIHAALQTGELTAACSLDLTKGARRRLEEETLAAAILLNFVAEAKGVTERCELPLLHDEQLTWSRQRAPLAWQDLLAGRCSIAPARVDESGRATSLAPPAGSGPRLIFPGAFDPRHDAHRGMARMAAERLGLPVEQEISVFNVDKPPLDFIEMASRAAHFAADEPLWFTRAATFVEKCALFPGATFIVGADTLSRIAQPKYYGGEPACQQAFDRLAAAGCRFLVFGRACGGQWQSLSDLRLREPLGRLCEEIPAAHFRHDISSTDLRNAQ